MAHLGKSTDAAWRAGRRTLGMDYHEARSPQKYRQKIHGRTSALICFAPASLGWIVRTPPFLSYYLNKKRQPFDRFPALGCLFFLEEVLSGPLLEQSLPLFYKCCFPLHVLAP